ncbi:MAG: hypothetical protein JWL77_4163 [Chthonomonadaceae bacterium]|nr:hypothetical protein [Chthonomonadaceae bacterium]
MATTLNIPLTNMELTPIAKSMIAYRWLKKGVSFIDGYVMLKDRGLDHYVSLHLFCQGMEIILKTCLLMRDYDTYRPKMGTKKYGHNLEELASNVIQVFGVRPLSDLELAELQKLNELYANHELRYATFAETINHISKATSKVTCNHLYRKMYAVVRLALRYSQDGINPLKAATRNAE